MTRFWLIMICIFFGTVAPASAGMRRYAISAEQVAGAVGRMGVQVTASQVSLLTDVGSSTPVPALQVRSVEKFEGGRFVVRMECASGDECVPFMASIQMREAGATQFADVAGRMSLLRSSYSNSEPAARPREIVIRNGSPAVLQLDGEHIHIKIPVICLGSGSAGEKIRVTDKDHRRVYLAEVVESGLLRGKL
jgi:hypothetical protein